ncbi:diguanylate cyclase [Niveibacterium sp. 24ML]|uniref:sensor domain-containing protein n=1 Tax=Niveibacterium sp. 24ML TaxID=2985512 RepID=UPI00226D7E72|nr:diguanylate cyclase [Niveibacterium sp. 24ML]MCX9156285.1 diguanylate cyclase [Niveibacterium sp. 24ML]
MPDPQPTPAAHIERLAEVVALPIGRWDTAARLIYCNSPYVQWAGRSRDQLLGRSLAELYGEAAWNAARPAFEHAFSRGETSSYERLLTHPPHPPRWARMQVFPDIENGVVASVFTIATDIHEDVLAREALIAARVRLDRFTENIPNPLIYLDRDGVIRFANKAYRDACGKPAEAIVDHHLRTVRGDAVWQEHLPYLERALAGETVHYSRLVDGLTHGPRWLRTSFVPDFDDDGAVLGLYTVTIDVHDLTIAQEQLRRSVERDALTDVLSRRAMMARIDGVLADALQAPVALYFVDLDGFKSVNDEFGHGEGDELLVRVGAALQASVRVEDAVGRFGGDEFLVLAEVRDAAGAEALAQHLLAAIRNVTALAGRVSASVGYALAPGDATQAIKLLQCADEAMYAAKRQGKNRVKSFAGLTQAR